MRRLPNESRLLECPCRADSLRYRNRAAIFHSFHGSRTSWMLKTGVPTAPHKRNQSGRYISVPRAPVISPRSTIFDDFHPNHSLNLAATSFFASASFPQIGKAWSPGTRPGLIITSQLTVLSALTTRALGNSRCVCSPSESVLQIVNEGGIPLEKSSGLPTWIRILPPKFSAPANRSAAIEFAPLVQSRTISPKPAASAKVPT